MKPRQLITSMKNYLRRTFPSIYMNLYQFKKKIFLRIRPITSTVIEFVELIITIIQIVKAFPLVKYIFSELELIKLNEPIKLFSQQSLQIVMIVVSEVWRDPRVEREARMLAQAGFQLKIIYPDYFSETYHLKPLNWGKNIIFCPLSSDLLNYIHIFPYVYDAKFLQEVLKERPFAFHAHDLSTAVIALMAAHKTQSYCICDFHEWYSENVTYNLNFERYKKHPLYKRLIYKKVEKLVLEKATAVVTVCDSIARELSKMTNNNRKISVIRNISFIETMGLAIDGKRNKLRDKYNISEETVIILYQGGVGPSRLLEPIIKAMQYIENATFIIRGPGIELYGPKYMALANKLNIADRIICAKSVPSDQVVDAAREADIGLWTLPNLSKNFYYALPNKVFEYLAAGIPIVCANFPEVAKIVNTYQVGLTFDPYDPKSIAASINKLCENPKLREEYKKNIVFALQDLKADQEWQKCVNLYRELAQGIPQ